MEQTTGLARRDAGAIIEQVIIKGDISQLSPGERASYYKAVCESLGLNPLTQPFQYISLQGKLTLYATRAATDQLRRIHGVSTTIVSEQEVKGIWIVKAKAIDREGRTEESMGAVSIEGLKGDVLCNALMKAETKAKRRATLALVGLGWLDESEVETIPNAHVVPMESAPANGHSDPLEPTEDNRQEALARLQKAVEAKGYGWAVFVRQLIAKRGITLDSSSLDQLNALVEEVGAMQPAPSRQGQAA